MLSDTRAIWFSPDGDKIAWTQFNDTDVSIRNIDDDDGDDDGHDGEKNYDPACLDCQHDLT